MTQTSLSTASNSRHTAWTSADRGLPLAFIIVALVLSASTIATSKTLQGNDFGDAIAATCQASKMEDPDLFAAEAQQSSDRMAAVRECYEIAMVYPTNGSQK